jgi:purine nucleoside permease
MEQEKLIAKFIGESLNHYNISDSDEPTADLGYYALIQKEGAYYILRIVKTGTVSTYRYYRGTSLANYQTDWTNRASLTYRYYNEVF